MQEAAARTAKRAGIGIDTTRHTSSHYERRKQRSSKPLIRCARFIWRSSAAFARRFDQYLAASARARRPRSAPARVRVRELRSSCPFDKLALCILCCPRLPAVAMCTMRLRTPRPHLLRQITSCESSFNSQYTPAHLLLTPLDPAHHHHGCSCLNIPCSSCPDVVCPPLALYSLCALRCCRWWESRE